MVNEFDQKWEELSSELLISDSNDFIRWEKLAEYSIKGLSKLSAPHKLERFRATYDQLLLKFPLLEQYWVNYAEKEFEVGNTSNSKAVFQRAISILPYSNLVWLRFLQLLKITELEYDNLIWFYQKAELKIGYHFHSYEFWKTYLELEKRYNGKSVLYFNILKKVIQIPIFNYSYFFRILMKEIESLDSHILSNLVSGSELGKKFKISSKEIDSKQVDTHDLKAKLKKTFTDVYITTQFITFEVYQFEKNIKLEYFVPGLIKSHQELENWEKYTSYMELNGTPKQIEQLYDRALVSTGSYPNLWLKYSDYYIHNKSLINARNLLQRSILNLSKSSAFPIQLKIIKLELSLQNYYKSKDVIKLLLENRGNNIELLILLIEVEYILAQDDISTFKSFLLDLIRKQSLVVSSTLLMELFGIKRFRLSSSTLSDLNHDGKFDHDYNYWFIYLNTVLESGSLEKAVEVYKTAVTKNDTNLDLKRRLYFWYECYLSHKNSSHSDIASHLQQSFDVLN